MLAPASAKPTATAGGIRATTVLIAMTTIVSHAFGRSTYGLLLPAIEDGLHLNHAQAGLGGTMIYAAYLVGVLTVAGVAPRLEPITIMRVGLGVGGCGLAVLSLAQGLGGLLGGLALTGAAGAGIWITAPALATTGIDPKKRGLVIGLLTATVGGATFLIGMGTRWLRAAGNEGLWRPVFVAEAVVAALLLVAVASFIRPGKTDRVGGGFSLAHLRAIPNWRRVTAAYALFAAIGAGFSPFVVEALEQDAGFSRSKASLIWSFMGVAGVIGAPLLGLFSDRRGRKPVMAMVLGVTSAALVTVALGQGWFVTAAVLVYSVVFSSFPPLVASYVRDHADARAFSSAFSTMTIFYSLLALTAPILTGRLADRTASFRAPFLVLAGLAIVGCGLVLGLPAAVDRPAA